MLRFSCKTLCAAIVIVLAASPSFAQSGSSVPPKSDKQIFDEKLPQAEADIAAMDETELRAFIGVLVDCKYLTQIAGAHFRVACNTARQKYRIEYARDRAVDYVMKMLEVAVEKNLTASTTSITSNDAARQDEARRALRLEDVRKAVEAAAAGSPPSAIAIIVSAESRLQKAASEAFKTNRAK